MTVWQQNEDVACVSNEHRACLLDLTRPSQLPVILEGAARVVYAMIDGTRNTGAVIAELSREYPDVFGLEDQVRSCLNELLRTGLILPV